jgi:hypothetical protein
MNAIGTVCGDVVSGGDGVSLGGLPKSLSTNVYDGRFPVLITWVYSRRYVCRYRCSYCVGWALKLHNLDCGSRATACSFSQFIYSGFFKTK